MRDNPSPASFTGLCWRLKEILSVKAPNKWRALAATGGFCLPRRGPVISRTDIFIVSLTPSFLCHPGCLARTLKP